MKIRLGHQQRSGTPGIPVGRQPRRTTRGFQLGFHAFTLLEVIVACGIFFLVAFSVLELVTRSLAGARALQVREPDAGMVASAFSITNLLEEGTESGNFEDLYPGLYPGYRWERRVREVSSNSLFEVEFVVFRTSKKGPSETTMTTLKFAPGSPPGSASGKF